MILTLPYSTAHLFWIPISLSYQFGFLSSHNRIHFDGIFGRTKHSFDVPIIVSFFGLACLDFVFASKVSIETCICPAIFVPHFEQIPTAVTESPYMGFIWDFLLVTSNEANLSGSAAGP